MSKAGSRQAGARAYFRQTTTKIRRPITRTMRMKGFTRPGRLARLLWIGALLAGRFATADVVRDVAGSCARVPDSAAALPEIDIATLGAGGSRASLGLAIHAPALRPLPWASTMDRHEVVVGAVDADHDDTYEYRLPYADDQSYPVTQG